VRQASIYAGTSRWGSDSLAAHQYHRAKAAHALKMPCAKCLAIRVFDTSDEWIVQHHASFSNLEASAADGCGVCALLADIYMEYCCVPPAYARYTGISREEGRRRQDERDREFDENKRTVFVVRGKRDFGSWMLFEGPLPTREPLRRLWFFRTQPDWPQKRLNFVFSVGEYAKVGVYSRPDSIAHREWDVGGREITSTWDASLALSWAQDCDANHDNCPKLSSDGAPLPPRVLDVGPRDTTPGSDIKLVITKDLQQEVHGRYAALSHCWGTSQPLRLTLATQKPFQQNIAFSQLPKTFRDAVQATRQLGLRYLWIDSLCIIQDCQQDWEEQCSLMRTIYQYAFVTLAGPDASDCDSGFLHPRDTGRREPLPITSPTSGAADTVTLFHLNRNARATWPSRNTASPLFTRGWVLQERLLSSRTLYFGAERMYFECFTNARFEDSHEPLDWDYYVSDELTKRAITSLSPSPKQLSKYWAEIASTYSHMALSKPTDRLPALSGIASEFHRVTGDQYLAGLWRQHLPQGLTWYVYKPEKYVSPIDAFSTLPSPASPAPRCGVDKGEKQQYIAPSWSWAAIQRGVKFFHSGERRNYYYDLQVDGGLVTTAGLDPLGAVSGGYLEVTGKLLRAVVKDQPKPLSVYLAKHEVREEPLLLPPAEYMPDDGGDGVYDEVDAELLHVGWVSELEMEYAAILAIVLVHVGREGDRDVYRRIGMVEYRQATDPPARRCVFNEALSGVERKSLRLV